MRRITERSIWSKILIAFLTFLLLFQFVMPPRVYADDDDSFLSLDRFWDNFKKSATDVLSDIGKGMLLGVARILAQLGDLVESAMNNFMLGVNGFGSAMISNEALTENEGSWFIAKNSKKEDYKALTADGDVDVQSHDKDTVIVVNDGVIEDDPNFFADSWEVPNILYSPENIFGNNIAMLDVNFLNPNQYKPVVEGSKTAVEKQTSIGESLHNTITSWYLAFRNIAIVALLSILVYLGIRILIGSTAEDKAKYKETIKDWAIALCLIFVMHFIMSAVIMIINRVNGLFTQVNENVYIQYGGTVFKSNYIGAIRFLAQSKATENAWVYTMIYLVLIFYTITFTIQYLKRVLYIAFYTMISPLVAVTYPMDKMGDGKSQAFNKWFKEYIMTMALQPIHLVLYTVLISSTLTLSLKQPLYALVAMGFLVEAEKFIKSLFGIQSQADGGFGSFASGALAMNLIDKVSKGGRSGGKERTEKKVEDQNDNGKIRQAKNKPLESFRSDSAQTPELNAGNETENNSENIRQENSNILPEGGNTAVEQNDESIRLNSANNTQNLGTGTEDNESIDFNNNPQLDEGSNTQARGQERTPENTGTQAQKITTPEDQFKRIRSNRRRALAKSVARAAGRKTISGVKKTGRLALKASGAAMIGSIGLAAGLAAGNGVSGVTKMALGGAAIGGAVGSRASNKIGNTVNSLNEARRNYTDNKTADYKNAGLTDKAEKREKQKAMKSKKYDKMIQDYEVKKGKKFSKDEKENLRSRIYDYDVKRGITDQDKIMKGLDLEDKYNPAGTQQHKYTHDQIADAMQLTNSYGREFTTNKDKIEQFDAELESYGVTDEKSKDDVKRLFYEVNGSDYDKAKAKRDAQKLKAEQQQQAKEEQQRIAQAEKEEKQRKAQEARDKRQAELFAEAVAKQMGQNNATQPQTNKANTVTVKKVKQKKSPQAQTNNVNNNSETNNVNTTNKPVVKKRGRPKKNS